VLELFSHRSYWRWAGAATLLRTAPLMLPFALVLASTRYTGSPAEGGLLVGVSMVPTMVAAPVAGRLLDRIGPTRWAPRLMVLGALIRSGLAVGFVLHLPAAALVVIALAGSTVTCGSGGVARALLQRTVPKQLIGTALSLDSVSTEIVVICAPFLVVVTSIAGAFWPLVATSLASAGSALLLRERRGAAVAEPASRPAITAARWSLLRNREFVFWVLVTMAFGQVMGSADISVLPISAAHGGGTAQAAVFSAVLGAASAATGLAYAWFGKRLKLSLQVQGCVLLLLFTVGVEFIAAASGWITLGVAFAVLGLWSAPLNTVSSEAPGLLVEPRRMAEAFNILSSAGVLGFAASGWLLSALTFHQVLLAAPATAVATLACAPFLLRGRHAEAETATATEAPSPMSGPTEGAA
jgi:hypothetical protein